MRMSRGPKYAAYAVAQARNSDHAASHHRGNASELLNFIVRRKQSSATSAKRAKSGNITSELYSCQIMRSARLRKVLRLVRSKAEHGKPKPYVRDHWSVCFHII